MKFLTLIIVLVFGKVAHSQLVTEHYVGPYVQSYLVLNKGDVVNCYTDISFSSVDSIVIDKEKEVIIVFTISESKKWIAKN